MRRPGRSAAAPWLVALAPHPSSRVKRVLKGVVDAEALAGAKMVALPPSRPAPDPNRQGPELDVYRDPVTPRATSPATPPVVVPPVGAAFDMYSEALVSAVPPEEAQPKKAKDKGEADALAQSVQQRGPGFDADIVVHAVDVQPQRNFSERVIYREGGLGPHRFRRWRAAACTRRHRISRHLRPPLQFAARYAVRSIRSKRRQVTRVADC